MARNSIFSRISNWAGAAIGLLLITNLALAEFTWVERPDPMREYQLADWDSSGDRVRILYVSRPDLEQSASKNWTSSVYIAELFPDGRIENRHLATGQRYFSSLLLQRDGEFVFAVPNTGHGKAQETMEIWSSQDGTLLSSFTSPTLSSMGGPAHPVFPTDDGNFFVVQHSLQTGGGRNEPTTLTWVKMSPEGDELLRNQWIDPTAVTGLGGVFPVAGGGFGIVLNKRLTANSKALQTDIEAIQQYEIAGRTIEARVFAETRMLSIDGSGAIQWSSPALERELLWDGEMAVPQDLPINQMLAQNNEQMMLMRNVALENDADRNIQHQQNTIYDDIQRGPGGYGMLVQVGADRNLEPPMHGVWFMEIGNDGKLQRQLRMEPIAESLDGKLERLLLTADGGMLVAGPQYGGEKNIHVTAIDSAGNTRWTTQAGHKISQVEGLEGSYESPWIFGHNWNEEHGKKLLWVEQIDPDSAQPLVLEAAASKPTPSKKPSAGAVPSFEMPEPPEGCECSCEEFATITELNENMKSMSQAEMLALITDPAYQASMNCMGACAMSYAQCR